MKSRKANREINTDVNSLFNMYAESADWSEKLNHRTEITREPGNINKTGYAKLNLFQHASVTDTPDKTEENEFSIEKNKGRCIII